MKIRSLVAVLAIFACTFSAAAQSANAPTAPTADISSVVPPAHPCTEAQVREYFTINHALDISQKTMINLVHSQRALSPPYLTPGFWDDMEKAVGQIDLVPLVVPSYQKYISEEDMAALIAFYKTEAGKRILEAQPAMASAISDAGRKAGEQVGAEVAKKHADEIQRLMKQQAAPPSPPAK